MASFCLLISVQAVFRYGRQDFRQHYTVFRQHLDSIGQDLGRVWTAFRQHLGSN